MCVSYLAVNFCNAIWYAFNFLVYQMALTPSSFPELFLHIVPNGYAFLTHSKTVNILGLGEEQKSNFGHQNNKKKL